MLHIFWYSLNLPLFASPSKQRCGVHYLFVSSFGIHIIYNLLGLEQHFRNFLPRNKYPQICVVTSSTGVTFVASRLLQCAPSDPM